MKKNIVLIALLAFSITIQAQQNITQYIDIKSNGTNSTEILMRKEDNVNYNSLFSNSMGFGLYNSANNGTNFLIDNVGNIGIGTIQPKQKLDVRGNAIINGSLISTVADANIGGTIQIDNPAKTASGTANSWKIYNMGGAYGNSLQFWAYDVNSCSGGMCTNRFTLMDNGNVGIGTATPNEKLSVNGNIRAREIKVEATNWPDYVFEENYKVGKLEELESYIKTNKHLPDMPTAKEIAINGLALGEVVRLQQQKIEELTLHLIDKDKALKKMELENKQFKTIQAQQEVAIKKMIERMDKIELKKL